MRPSFIRAQWTSGVLFGSTSIRCRICPQKFWFTSNSRSISTSQASTQSHDANADLSSTTKHGLRPAVGSAASSMPQHSSPNGIISPTQSTPKRRKVGRPRDSTITTLDRARLNPSCFLDASGHIYLYIYDVAAPEAPRMLRMTYTTTLTDKQKFPPDTRGFLYFHADAHNPLESQIRFRVTHDRDPMHGFASGHDLRDPSGYIWHIPVEHVTKAPTLRQMLLRDGLVDDALFAQLQARAGSRTRPRRLKRGITSLSQPFTLEFNKKTFHLIVRVAEQDRMYKTVALLRFYTKHGKYLVYKAGSGLCRLERSDLPQHAGRRIVVMRLLKILQPPKLRSDLPPTCDVSVPAEGELFTWGFGQRVWYRDVDKPGKGGEILRLLYDVPDDGEQAFGQSL